MPSLRTLLSVGACLVVASAAAQMPQRGFGGGGRANDQIRLVDRFDRNDDGRLDADERQAARQALTSPSGRAGRGDMYVPPATPAILGARLKPADVKRYGQEPLYDPAVLRTLFITFDTPRWEDELAFFYNTDVEIPATVQVDGKTYPDVGIHFRGQTSYRMVSDGEKRSLNLSFDFVNDKQRLLGYKTLNLLNSAADPTSLRAVLYMHVARDYFPAPKTNYVRVVINGESWGTYASIQQFDTDFTKEASGGSDARWKVPGSPRSRGAGLVYLGEDGTAYRNYYEIKSKDRPESWASLARLAKVLNETPPDRLKAAIEPMLDVDGVLRFLAVEKALINNDGYWTRGSDYSLWIDEQGRFHVAPQDVNETLRPLESFGWGAGGFQGREGVELDPMAGADDPTKPLLYRLMAVPEYRERYLGYIRDIAERWLAWEKLGPVAKTYHDLIAKDMQTDVRKLHSFEEFRDGLEVDRAESFAGPISTPGMSLKTFADQRRAYLLRWFEEQGKTQRARQRSGASGGA